MLLFPEAAGPKRSRMRENPVARCLRDMAAMYSTKYHAPLSLSWKRDAAMAARTAREWDEAARKAGMTPTLLLVSAWERFLLDPYHERSRHALPVFWRHRQRYLVEALDKARGIELQVPQDLLAPEATAPPKKPHWMPEGGPPCRFLQPGGRSSS